MKTALFKDIYREILRSLPRFLSITLMISLGVFVYSGLKGAAPLMRHTINDFTQKTNMADLKIDSLFGLDRKDMSLILSQDDLSVAEFHYSVDLNTLNSDLLIQVQSMPESISIPYLTDGRYPVSVNEILMDSDLRSKGFQLGDVITFKKEVSKFQFKTDDQPDALKRYQFQIVGFCYHPEFIQPYLKGEANDGLGKLDGFAFVMKRNFDLEDYRFARLKLHSTGQRISEDKEYKKISENAKEALSTLLGSRPKIRLRNLRKEAMDAIRKNETKLSDARRQLDDAKDQLDFAKKKLENGQQQLEVEKEILAKQTKQAESEIRRAEEELTKAKEKIDTGSALYLQNKQEWENGILQYQSGYASLESGKAKLTLAESDLTKNKDKLDEGLQQIDSALHQLDGSEQQLLHSLSQLGISVEDFKRRVTLALNSNRQQEIVQMGEPAIRYAELLQARHKLLAEKKELLLGYESIQSAFKQLAEEKAKLAAGEKELMQVKQELDLAQAALRNAKSDLDQGVAEYTQGLEQLQLSKEKLKKELAEANSIINKAEKELLAAKQDYENGKKTFEDEESDAEEKIADGKKKIDDAKKVIKALKEPAYQVQTRDDLNHYFIYFDSAKRIEFLSDIFPVFFFLIAMLVCLSTMTRMAEEHRGQIGTLKAMGYGNWDIAKKYFYYGLFSSLIGGTVGISFGQPILSRVVYMAYNDAFVVQTPLFKIFWRYNFFSVLIGIACTAFVAFFVVNKHLQKGAAALMRPKAPKSGTKIMLERFRFVWKRMSFLQKVTARNMFRYKARMLMAISGISGCTALVFLGFSLRDSVSHLLPVQFEELTHYHYLAFYDEDLSDSAAEDFLEYLDKSPVIETYSTIYLESFHWKKSGMSDQDVQILVPQNPEDYKKMQTLRDPDQNQNILEFPEESAIITNKLAKLAKLRVGDFLEIRDDDNKKTKVKIGAISENYLGHYLYMDQKYYGKLFGKDPDWNAKAIVYHSDPAESGKDTFVSKLLDFDVVLSVAETNFATAEQSLASLDVVVGIMILLSSLLAFVVLYNLSNINISERMRELSTIKVLGFFPKELTTYVYRETFSLSIIGIGFGFLFGILLHKMILEVIVPDAFQLYPKIFPLTYGISALMTLLFSVIVMVFVHFRLKRIDMVEALKSYE